MPRELARVGAYALKRTLGKGAFGWVKLAVQDKTGAKVAIKVRRRRRRPMANANARTRARTPRPRARERARRERED